MRIKLAVLVTFVLMILVGLSGKIDMADLERIGGTFDVPVFAGW